MGPSKTGNSKEWIWGEIVVGVCIRVLQRNKIIGYIYIDVGVDSIDVNDIDRYRYRWYGSR